nr:MAG TPA: hypothetical protein [Caudoviricetes sp.]
MRSLVVVPSSLTPFQHSPGLSPSATGNRPGAPWNLCSIRFDHNLP